MSLFAARPCNVGVRWNVPETLPSPVAAFMVTCLAHLYATEYAGTLVLFGRN